MGDEAAESADADARVALTAIRHMVSECLEEDAARDFEVAHGRQDKAAEVFARWAAEHSSDPAAREMAAEVLRAFDSGGARWYG